MPHYGFNFLWMFSWHPEATPPLPDERALDFMSATGFDFVRVPTDYRYWTRDFNYFEPDEQVFEALDHYLAACRTRDIHMSLNLHRAPGYCINRNDLERHNLWVDDVAQDAFVFTWEAFTRRYQGVPSTHLSFDLLNEPPNVGQYGLTRAGHATLIRRTVDAIRAIDPHREIVIDGLGGGHLAMPELADADVIHSGRGYQPMPVSHHRATWWPGHTDAPEPRYPGVVWEGVTWDRDALRAFYGPWRDVEAQGVRVHIGECGCYNKTPNDVAMRWLTDLFETYRDFGWGYALWNFAGDFGVIDHGRPGARYETMHGYRVDPELLELLQRCRVKAWPTPGSTG
jgi:endoglucanase